jgi:hypothetical protein
MAECRTVTHITWFRIAESGVMICLVATATAKRGKNMDTILWIIAAIVGIIGVVRILQRDILWGAVLIVVALLIGPGGVSIFS